MKKGKTKFMRILQVFTDKTARKIHEYGIMSYMKNISYIFIGTILLLFVANIALGASWFSPTQPFSLTAPAPDLPLDTSSSTQTKKGTLILGKNLDLSIQSASADGILFKANQKIKVNNSAWLMPLSTSGISSFYNGSSYFAFNTQGLLLPNAQKNSISQKPGMLTYDNGTAWLYNGTSWVDLAGGGGSGSSKYWSELGGPENILFIGQSVGITNFTTSQSEKGFVINQSSSPQEITPSGIRLPCDTNPIVQDCPSPYIINGYNIGDVGYDEYEEQNVYGGRILYDVYDYRVVSSPKNTAVLSTGDINIDNPKWSDTTGEMQGSGGVEPWTTCPDGYFVSAARIGNSSGNPVVVVKCSKL